jgi:hypothetical protein
MDWSSAIARADGLPGRCRLTGRLGVDLVALDRLGNVGLGRAGCVGIRFAVLGLGVALEYPDILGGRVAATIRVALVLLRVRIGVLRLALVFCDGPSVTLMGAFFAAGLLTAARTSRATYSVQSNPFDAVALLLRRFQPRANHLRREVAGPVKVVRGGAWTGA